MTRWILLGALSGIVVAGLAVVMAGGGHGWISPLLSMSAPITLSASGVVWATRRSSSTTGFACVVVLPHIVTDAFVAV